jgi:hypothetical protein
MKLSELTAELANKTTLQQRQILKRCIGREIEMQSMICDIDADSINLDFISGDTAADKRDWDIQLFFDSERFGKELLSYGYGDDVAVVATLRSTELDHLQILTFDLQRIRKVGTTLDSRDDTRAKAEASRCFIATAAYGSAAASDVLVLRSFRDDVLMKLSLGRGFVRLYERLSPSFAVQMRRRPMLRAAVRSCICPVARTIARIRGYAGRG